MTTTLKSAAITIALALIAGIAGMGIGRLLFTAPAPADNSLHGMVHQDLTLTDEQNTQIHGLESTFAVRKKELEDELRLANTELAEAILKSDAAGPEVEAAVRHFHQAMGTLQTKTIDHVFAMRRILNSDQRARFDKKVQQALTADGQ